jgi:2-iminobutanoate/2-iminopropanoate deaminase
MHHGFELNEGRKMYHTIHDIGVASQIAAYSDAIEVSPNLRWLLTSGTPGLSTNGDLPKDISGQAELAWQHIVRMLEEAAMTIADIVKVTQYLTRAEDIPAYGKVRTRFLGEVRPASMLLVIPQLVRPEFLVEVEIVAARV